MAEYIERDAIIGKAIDEKCFVFSTQDVVRDEFVVKTCYKNLAEVVYSIPIADVAPVVHGRWIPSESDFDDDDTLFDGEEWCDWQCSACREDICYDDPMPMKLLPKYCPNCGAKMDEEDKKQ